MNFENLKNFMDYMAENISPGNAVCVYKDGVNVFNYAAGYNDLENKIPMQGDELFAIYSCSKITTVTAGIQMLEKGIFLIDDPLYEYMPEFKDMYIKTPDGKSVKAKNPIRIGDLFSMTAGFTYDFNTEGYKKAREITNGKFDTAETIRCLAVDPLSFEPGTKWQYSVCHDILAGLVSVVTGKKFRDYVKENIFEPLNMTESCYHITDNVASRMAEIYGYVPEGDDGFDIVEAQKSGFKGKGMFVKQKKENHHILGDEYDSGGAGIITSVSDYSKLMYALANYGMGLTGERILSKNAVNLMRTNRLHGDVLESFNWQALKGCGYGLGVRTQIRPDVSGVMSTLGEFGWGGAAGATAIIDPENNLSLFFAQHTYNPREEWYQPRLRNVIYSCLD